MANWSNNNLVGYAAGAAATSPYFAGELLSRRLRDGDVDGALALVSGLPGEAEKRRVLDDLTGASSFDLTWDYISPDKRLELYRKVAALPDEGYGAEVARACLGRWAKNHPDELRDLAPSLSPTERFQVSLYLLGMPSPVVKDEGDGITQFSYQQPRDFTFAEMERSSLPAGLAAGLSSNDALKEIAGAVMQRQIAAGNLGDGFSEWLESHSGEMELLASTLRLTSCIQDPGSRLLLSRAVFQRMLAADPVQAGAYLPQLKLPSGLTEELQSSFFPKP